MIKQFMGLGCAAALVMATSAQAGYVLEIDTDGADDGVLTFHPSFGFGGDTTTAGQSALSTAVGMTGGDSIFGGNGSALPDAYVANYTPALDGDNNGTNPVAGQILNQLGATGSNLAAGGSGLYDVYTNWPHTNNVSGGLTTYTLTDGVGTLFSVQIDQNTAMPQRDVTGDGIPDPGAGGEWVYLGSAVLDAGTQYTLTQEAGTNSFVSMRAAGYLFDAVPEPASLSLLGLGGLMMLGRKRS
jgi:hypothetical protein